MLESMYSIEYMYKTILRVKSMQNICKQHKMPFTGGLLYVQFQETVRGPVKM